MVRLERNELKNIEIRQDHAIFSINPNIYPLEIIYSAAYIMIDKAFIVLDGDPKSEIKIEIRKKHEQQDLKELVQDFNEELLNYAVYKSQSEKNKGLREAILQRVLMTNSPDAIKDMKKKEEQKECECKEEKEENHDGCRKKN